MDDLISIGRVVRAQGMKGEVRVQSLTDFPERLTGLKQVWMTLGQDAPRIILVEKMRWQKSAPIFKFVGVNSRDEAEHLIQGLLQLRREELLPLPSDTFYVFEVVGMTVLTEEGQTVGTVVEVLSLPANDVYVVASPAGEILIPATKEVVREVNTAKRTIVIRPLAGLLEVQRRG